MDLRTQIPKTHQNQTEPRSVSARLNLLPEEGEEGSEDPRQFVPASLTELWVLPSVRDSDSKHMVEIKNEDT